MSPVPEDLVGMEFAAFDLLTNEVIGTWTTDRMTAYRTRNACSKSTREINRFMVKWRKP